MILNCPSETRPPAGRIRPLHHEYLVISSSHQQHGLEWRVKIPNLSHAGLFLFFLTHYADPSHLCRNKELKTIGPKSNAIGSSPLTPMIHPLLTQTNSSTGLNSPLDLPEGVEVLWK